MRPRRRPNATLAPPRGLILDIRRNVTDEGPGSRTVVLLKGCPLRCLWCHAPDGDPGDAEHFPLYRALCNNCYNCLIGGQPTAENLSHHCKRCGSCVETCAQSACSSIGRRTEVADLLELLEQDRAGSANPGGLTIAGGEPMAQFGFTAALLNDAHDRRIHTCLVTSGVARPDQFDQVLEDVDLFIFDYKSTDELEHIHLTAISNDQILDNFDLLYHHGCRIVLRCPLLPGVNDTDSHLRGIARMTRNYPKIESVQFACQPPAARCPQAGRQAEY